jgi:hypothetical protein
MAHSSAARTNLSSNNVDIHLKKKVGEGAFRIAYAGTYRGGTRNNQDAVCKRFKDEFRALETEFFLSDFHIADKAIAYAEDWNRMCQLGEKILVTRGDVRKTSDGTGYLIEPFIRSFTKYTSNNGWIEDDGNVGWVVEALEAFSHYTYHRSGGQMIVCDLQGRYRHDRFSKKKSRFELTDPAICSRLRNYGPTDLGEKGIESFFANHSCNAYCHQDGNWARPRVARRWFSPSHNTSMLRATATNLLDTRNRARFTNTMQPIYDDSDSDDSW